MGPKRRGRISPLLLGFVPESGGEVLRQGTCAERHEASSRLQQEQRRPVRGLVGQHLHELPRGEVVSHSQAHLLDQPRAGECKRPVRATIAHRDAQRLRYDLHLPPIRIAEPPREHPACSLHDVADACVAAQLIEGPRPPVPGEVVRRSTGDKAGGRQAPCHKATISRLAKPEHKVQPLCHDVGEAIGEPHVKHEAGVLGRERRQDAGHWPLAEQHGRGKAHPACERTGVPARLSLCLSDALQDVTGTGVQRLAFWRRHDPARGAGEQPDAKPCLQPDHGLGHGRRGDAEPACGGTEAARLRHGRESSEVAHLVHGSLSTAGTQSVNDRLDYPRTGRSPNGAHRPETRKPVMNATPTDAAVVLTAEDRLGIADALYRLGAGIDEASDTLLASAFTADAAAMGVEFPPLAGRDATASTLAATVGKLDTTHAVSNPRITVEDGRVVLRALVEAAHFPPGDRSRRCVMHNRYTADMRREDGAWRITHMEMQCAWFDGDPQVLLGQ